MNSADLLSALRFRYATKAFDPDRSVPENLWADLLESLVLAPSSFGLQPWKFLVVEDPTIRAELRQVSWNQPQVTEASKLVVFAARTDLTPADTRRWLERLSEVQDQPLSELEGYGKVIDGFAANLTVEQRLAWNTHQVYLALGQFMTSAALLRIDTCPLEGLDPASYDRILALTGSGYATCVACAVGYRRASDHHAARPKARFAPEEVVEVL
jgi:nitroreductase